MGGGDSADLYLTPYHISDTDRDFYEKCLFIGEAWSEHRYHPEWVNKYSETDITDYVQRIYDIIVSHGQRHPEIAHDMFCAKLDEDMEKEILNELPSAEDLQWYRERAHNFLKKNMGEYICTYISN